jgi:polysaccharide deacetylase family protein (PEP-CTERM system associated)
MSGGLCVRNAMSVDVEDYFHVSAFDDVIPRTKWTDMESRVCANTHRLLDIFDEFNVRCTFFVLGWVAEHHPQLVRDITRRGHEIASHGFGHRLVYDQTPAMFREDVRRAKHLLEDISGCRIFGYRAPSFSITARSLWALDILIDEGYSYDASVFPIRHDRYGIPRSPRHPYIIQRADGSLMEMPGSTVRVGPLSLPIGGGGYFRIIPYAWTCWGINRVNRREHEATVFYLHPWEIDPDQPRIAAGRLSRFRHYRNLDRTEGRLRRLLTDFAFGTMASLLGPRSEGTQARNVVPHMLPYL